MSTSENESAAEFTLLPDVARLEALAEFAAGAGHEINNPLATIIGRAQLLLKDEKDPQRRQMLMTIGVQAYRIRDMIGDAMLFGRPPRPELEEVNLLKTVQLLVEKQADELTSEQCSIQVDVDQSIILRADSVQLSVVLSELVKNSRNALRPHGGNIQIRAVSQSGQAIIEIVDRGAGFTEVERQHAFDPFFSGRQAGRGLGFGLPKCWRIVDQHSGHMEIESSSKSPTIVRILWPMC